MQHPLHLLRIAPACALVALLACRPASEEPAQAGALSVAAGGPAVVAEGLRAAKARALPPLPVSATPATYELLFVVVTDPSDRAGALLDAEHYEKVLRRSAIALERESLNRMRLSYEILELPIGKIGVQKLEYGKRRYSDWYALLRDQTRDRRYDILGFAPDRVVDDWCRDAHSFGFQLEDTKFLCLEPAVEVAPISDLLLHKLFHTFGFFHQQLRNRQYRLLDGDNGLPTVGLTDFEPADPALRAELASMAFFSPLVLSAMGVLPGDGRGCDVGLPLHCSKPTDFPFECRDVVGPYCLDADRDGVTDLRDGFPLTPPGGGLDTDHDGIPDRLDLCAGSELTLTGNIEGGPLNYWAEASTVELSVQAPIPVELRWTPASMRFDKVLGELMTFEERREQATPGGKVRITPDTRSPVRIRIAHRHLGRDVRRSVYVYTSEGKTSPAPWGYFNEKEWYYFGRFGCDVPAEVDIYDVRSFDSNSDGLPDPGVLPTTVELPADYDWDADGVVDGLDTLPSVAGTCSNDHVRGVRDSDGDGLCDPGALDFHTLPPDVPRDAYFGELPRIMGADPTFDRCPYLAGTGAPPGCPPRPDGKAWYADDYPFSDDGAPSTRGHGAAP